MMKSYAIRDRDIASKNILEISVQHVRLRLKDQSIVQGKIN